MVGVPVGLHVQTGAERRTGAGWEAGLRQYPDLSLAPNTARLRHYLTIRDTAREVCHWQAVHCIHLAAGQLCHVLWCAGWIFFETALDQITYDDHTGADLRKTMKSVMFTMLTCSARPASCAGTSISHHRLVKDIPYSHLMLPACDQQALITPPSLFANLLFLLAPGG